MSCRSLSMEHGITDSHEPTASIRQSLIKRSQKIYIVADFSKFNNTSFLKISDFAPVTGLITDKPLSREWQDFLSEHNVDAFM